MNGQGLDCVEVEVKPPQANPFDPLLPLPLRPAQLGVEGFAYYYPGGSISGPVLLPFTKFNRKHDKLFFYTGYQYFYQVLDTGLLRATVPTAGELTGNFSPAEVAKEGNINASGGPPGQIKDLVQFPGGKVHRISVLLGL